MKQDSSHQPGGAGQNLAGISSGVTLRAALIGLVLSGLLAYLDVGVQAVGATGLAALTSDGHGSGALFFLCLLICITTLLKRLGILRSGLAPRELLVIFSMLLMVSGVTTRGLMSQLIPHMVGFAHYATPDNKWDSQVLPILPDGLTIVDPSVAKGFFEGMESGEGAPYRSWVGPLLAWGLMLAALYLTMISVMVILRKPWMDQERLPFPIAQLPLSLIEGDAGEPPLLRNRVFWAGFAVPALVGLSRILHGFLPFIKTINFSFYVRFFRNSIGLPFYTDFYILGICYLVSLEILGSILLFTLISYFQTYLIILSGSPLLGSPPYTPYAHHTHLHQETIGALVVLVGFGLYEARGHLRDVFRKAFGSASDVEDGDEILSYRSAVIGSMVGLVFTGVWLRLTGISLWVIPVFLGVMVVTFTGVTRVLAESGLVLRAPLSPMQLFLHSAGTQMLGGPTTAGFFLAQPWSFPARTHVMASTSTTLKLTHRKGRRSGPMLTLAFLALFVGGVTAAATMLHYAYSLGAYGFTDHYYVIKALNYHMNYYGGAIVEPSEGQPIRLFWSGLGAVIMGLLILARKLFYWWPILPVGFLIGNLPSWAYWINVLVAWLVKRNVLKYGGPSLYGRTRPFFLGLILAEAVSKSLFPLLAMITGNVNF